MDARADFWVIKHGIKMTGMPAWGASHDDEKIWSVVAFLRKLAELDARRYREMVAKAPADEEVNPKASGKAGAILRHRPSRKAPRRACSSSPRTRGKRTYEASSSVPPSAASRSSTCGSFPTGSSKRTVQALRASARA